MPPTSAPPVLHPLAPLTGDEIMAAREIVFASGRAEVTNELLRFAYMGLCDPPKDLVRAFDRGEKVDVDRRVRVVLLQGPVADVTEAIVSVTRGEVDRWEVVRDVRPPLQIEESIHVLAALHEHPEWNAALDRRGIVDRSLVQIDPWPAGTFGLAARGGPADHPLPRLPPRVTRRQRLRPAARGPAGLRRHGPGRGARGGRPRGRPVPAEVGQLLPRGQRAAAHRPQAARDHPARGPELRGRRQPRALAEVVAARRHGPARGPRPLHGRL